MTTIITELPLFTDERYIYGTNIESQSKQFEFYWNSRSSQWHMDIRNEDQTIVVQGVALVADYPMLVDHPMEEFGLTGYFVLLSNIAGVPPPTDASIEVVPENYVLSYVYLTE